MAAAAERAAYEVRCAERRYRAVDPDNRLVARGRECEWEQRLADLQAANEELARRSEQRRSVLLIDSYAEEIIEAHEFKRPKQPRCWMICAPGWR